MDYNRLNKARKIAIIKCWLGYGIIFAGILCTSLFIKEIVLSLVVIIAVFSILIFFTVFIANPIIDSYKHECTEEAIRNLVNDISFKTPKNYLATYFNNSNIVKVAYNLNIADYFNCRYQNSQIEKFDISDFENKKKGQTNFIGQYLSFTYKLDFDKDNSSIILASKRMYYKTPENYQKQEVNNLRLSEKFDVFTNVNVNNVNQVINQKIASSILRYYENYNNKILLELANGKINIFINSNIGSIRPKLKQAITKNELDIMRKDIKNLSTLINLLNK